MPFHRPTFRECRPLAAFPAVLLAAICAAADPPVPGDDWPRYGHDGALTGRSPLHGRIATPRVAWTYSVAGRDLQIELTPEPGEHSLPLPGEGPADARQIALQGPEPRDLDGSGTLRPAPETHHERWASILPGVRGLQRVAWDHTWTDQAVCHLQLFAYDGGFDKPRQVWQTDPPEGTVFNPLDIVYDIDGDGVQEVCVAAHYRVMIFEGTTGRKETELRYHHCRPYGWFGLADVDGDGRMELITIGDFQSHIDVLKYDPAQPEAKRLSVLWRRDIEEDITERKKWPQIGPRPVADVTGDGRPEIVLNLFGDTGDQQWHTVALDGVTGKTIADLPRKYLQGVADVDGDGAAELFVAASDGVRVPPFGRIELVGLRGGAPSVKASWENAAWAAANLPRMGPTWSTSATEGMRHVLLAEGAPAGPKPPGSGEGPPGQRPAFLVRTRGAGEAAAVAAVRCDAEGRPQEIWRCEGVPADAEVVAVSAVGPPGGVGALLRATLPAGMRGTLVGRGVRPRRVQDSQAGVGVSMPIAARLRPGGPMTIIVEGAGRRVFALEPPAPQAGLPAGGAASPLARPEPSGRGEGPLAGPKPPGGEGPRLLWQRPGRGMTNASGACGPLAADLDGDGGCEVAVADQTSDGRAELATYRHDGSVLWRRSFDQIPGGSPMWNEGMLTYWWPGHFRSPDKIDLFVNTRRHQMHSDIGQLLDGRDGTILWSHDKAVFPKVFSWGYAGIPLAVADLNGDRLDELVCLYPVCYWAADGRDGRITAAQDLASRKLLPAWAAYGEPIVHDFTGGGRPQVLLDSPYILALLDAAGVPLRHGPGRVDFAVSPTEGNASEVTGTKHALIDIDGDGRFEIASGGYGNGVRVIDPRDGKVLWSLAAPAPTVEKVSAADIDGRVGDELIYAAGDKLIAITGDRTGGRILWTWQGPAALSMPAIADIDGDGQAEIVVQAADGTVICLDGEGR